jgi:hypothetical protein
MSWRCSFVHDLKLVEAIQLDGVGHDREIKQAATQRPRTLIPFGGRAIGIAPGVRRIVEGAGIDQRPVHEIAARIVRIRDGIEQV